MPRKIDLTISIVSFNTKTLLKRCIESIYKHTKGVSLEIIVVDNHSKDGSARMIEKDFKKVKLIKNKDNKFYSGANNQALKIAKGEYFLILNSDIFLKDNAIKKLLTYLKKNQTVGAVEPLQVYEDGKVAPTGSKHNSPLIDFFELTWLGRLFKNRKNIDSFRMVKKDRTKTFSAQVICDAVMMIKTSLLKKIDGYDEKLLLYYTENDLCKRIQKLKLKTVHLGTASVWHTVSASTDKAGWKFISDIYTKDAFSYYKKHGPKLGGYLLFLNMKLNNLLIHLKKNLWLILILLLATWVRFYKLGEFMTFIGDQGRDYLAARDLILTGKLPLVGIPSSVPWLHQGVFFIWLTALALKLGSFSPITPAIMTAVIGVATVFLTYVFSSHWFGKKAGLIASLVAATSPLMVIHSRMPYHTSPIPLVSLIFIFSTYLYLTTQIKLFWPVFFWAILLQFELTALPLILLIPFFWYLKRKKPTKKHFKTFFVASLIPFLPKVIYDFTHGFKQTLGFIAWAGYRVLSFFGFRGQHTFSLGSFLDVNKTIFVYWQKFISWGSKPVAIAVAIVVLLSLILSLKNNRKTSLEFKLIFSFIFLNFFAFYLHQGPSEAYFPVLFPAWTLAIAWVVNYLKKPVITVLFILLSIYNLNYLIKNNFLPYGPNLTERIKTVRLIKRQSINKTFKLQNHSSTEQFDSYLDNYRYLLWWLDSPEDLSSSKIYTIYDGDLSRFKSIKGANTYYFNNSLLISHD